MHILARLAATGLAFVGLTAIPLPAYADDISGSASVQVDEGYIRVCWDHKGKCYFFGPARVCDNTLHGTFEEAIDFVNNYTMGSVKVEMYDCGAKLGGAYAGELCIFTDSSSACFNVQENKSLRMELDY